MPEFAIYAQKPLAHLILNIFLKYVFLSFMCRRVTLDLAAVWVAVGVNAPLLPYVPLATLSHTAASVAQGSEADIVSVACLDSGTTARLAARVSMTCIFQLFPMEMPHFFKT